MKKIYKYLILLFCLLFIIISVCFVPINASKLIPVIEKQVEKDLGVKVHIDKLILRVGPYFKIKTPIMHIMYNDGQKFAQFNNVRFYVSFIDIFKDNPELYKIRADKLTVRVNSDDKFIEELLLRLDKKSAKSSPILTFKTYKITYNNKIHKSSYSLEGQDLELTKIKNLKSYKIKTKGVFNIDTQKYFSYDLNLIPNVEIPDLNKKYNIIDSIEQLKELDFKADIIADLKLYKNKLDLVQASGFINIDNISVLDKQKKNPKSFIYLTLWGDKASILSNIYTSQTQKIYLEGSLNNSVKPVVDLKVKTDEIDLRELYKKLKVLTCFSNLKNINNLDGILIANFILKGDLNKIKSSGYLKINNASVKANGVLIDRINSEIDFNDNIINIVKAVGFVNNSPILAKGKIDKNIDVEILMNKVGLKYLFPENFGVKNGIISLVASFNGQLNNIIHKENISINDFKWVKNSTEISFDNFKLDTNKNNIASVENIFCKNAYTENIKIPSVKLNVERDFIKINDTNIFMPNSLLTFKGEISNYINNNFTFNTNITGFINSKDILKFNNNSARYPLKLMVNGNKNIQNINSQLFIENTSVFEEPVVLNLISKAEKNSLKIDDLSLSTSEDKDFKEFKNMPKTLKKISINGIIEDVKNPYLKNLRVFIPQQINLHVCDTLISLKGDFFITGNYYKPDIIGQLNIINLINQNLELAVNNLVLDFNKNNTNFNIPLLKLSDTLFNISGNFVNKFDKNFSISNMNIKSKYVNTDTLLMYKDSPIFKKFKPYVINSKLYFEKILLNLYDSEIYLSAFTSDMSLIDNIIRLNNLSTELYNGKIAGNLAYNLHDEHYKTSLMGRGVSSSSIFSIISDRKDTISGLMDFDAEITGELTSKRSLNGNLKFIINNGRMSTLGKLEHLLYAQNVIADNMLRTSLSVITKAITLKDTGLFKYLRGDINLNNGVANINMLQSQGPLMALFIKGLYNPINDQAQLTILGRLSDEIISGLGTFGDFSFNKLLIMLTGEENHYNIIPEDFEKIPQLQVKNTKEFRSVINGNIDKPSSVLLFNWISYSQKNLKQKEIPMTNTKVPKFIDELPY